MFKRLVALTLSVVMVMGMSTMTLALETSNDALPISKEVILSGEANIKEELNDVVNLEISQLKKTGEKISLPKQRSGQIIENAYGTLTGTLSETNTWDYYLFSSDSAFSSIAKIATDNPSYTMTLGIVDFDSGNINLTNYIMEPNQALRVNFEAGAYAWVIQSSDATYGESYQLQYNTALSNLTNLIYMSSDLQKLYAVSNQKLTVNGQIKNINYRYDMEWELPGKWHRLHIWMDNANVAAIHVGGVQYYQSAELSDYPNAIVLSVKLGGVLTHQFSQNPPYYNWYNKDAAGMETPRAIDYTDLTSRGEHYLIYDLNTDTVVEFASGLVKTWSPLGDKHDLRIY